jgi:hypothetical protein
MPVCVHVCLHGLRRRLLMLLMLLVLLMLLMLAMPVMQSTRERM